ncbi:MAG TPA: acetolactate synthase small subunit [Ghiorsea sp.]|nr:acetolactate synthase small subunit [Ghiorsea sp.]HIP06486.1 acetolactate synthase small subunit [Mariprofundaceae bacterium]
MRHTITILVENEFGVLTRIAGLFSARGYNIETLNVAPTADETVSRLTLVTIGDEKTVEQIKKQLNKLIPVIKTEDISHMVHIERGLLMLKVVDAGELLKTSEAAGAKVIDHEAGNYFIAEFTGSPEEVDVFLASIDEEYIIEASRTGPVGMRRGSKGFVV